MTSIRSLIDWVTGKSKEEQKMPVVEPVIVVPTPTEPETRQDMKEDDSPLSIILSLSPILGVRSYNLARVGIKTIPDLNRFNRMSDSELLAIKGIGRSTLGDIRHFGSPTVLQASILRTMSYNLARIGIKTIPDLNRFNHMSDSELLTIKGIGRSTVDDIRHFNVPLRSAEDLLLHGGPERRGKCLVVGPGSGEDQYLNQGNKLGNWCGTSEVNRYTPPTPYMDIETPVVAFRGWNLKSDGQKYLLESPQRHHLWIPNQPNKAVKHTTDCPVGYCLCGFYATKDKRGAMGRIIGTVEMWGRYVEHELGWRTEYAYPKSVVGLVCDSCLQEHPFREMQYSNLDPLVALGCNTCIGRNQRYSEMSRSKLRQLMRESEEKERVEMAKHLYLHENREWLPAVQLLERIEHTYGMEVN